MGTRTTRSIGSRRREPPRSVNRICPFASCRKVRKTPKRNHFRMGIKVQSRVGDVPIGHKMQNLEIKARYADHRRAARLAIEQVDAVYSGQLVQTDIYFHVATGRLKMRHERLHSLLSSSWDEERFELIHYH